MGVQVNKKQLIAVLLLSMLIQPSIVFAKVAYEDSGWKTTAVTVALIGADIKKATGYDWVEWPPNKKIALMSAMFDFYKLDSNQYSVEKGVELLDTHYYAAHKTAQERPDLNENVFFSAPCLITFGSFIEDKESDWGIRAALVK